MKISGFAIVRNAVVFDYPVVESIRSVLDLVDEFVLVMGDNTDETEALVATIDSPKLKIIHTTWDMNMYPVKGMIYAYQTDLALKACTGDWCVYIQADEVLHEKAVDVIRRACEKYNDDQRVEGFLLKYVHLYGNYDHYNDDLHFAYPKEIRIVRNLPDVHSWRDAQSFRIMPDFDYKDYYQKKNTRKLNCVLLDAEIFHYGWSRNPYALLGKTREQDEVHYKREGANTGLGYKDYGNLSVMPRFTGSHPAIMKDRIAAYNWEDLLRYDGPPSDFIKKFKPKYRFLYWIEHYLLGGHRIFGFRNYRIVGTFK